MDLAADAYDSTIITLYLCWLLLYSQAGLIGFLSEVKSNIVNNGSFLFFTRHRDWGCSTYVWKSLGILASYDFWEKRWKHLNNIFKLTLKTSFQLYNQNMIIVRSYAQDKFRIYIQSGCPESLYCQKVSYVLSFIMWSTRISKWFVVIKSPFLKWNLITRTISLYRLTAISNEEEL